MPYIPINAGVRATSRLPVPEEESLLRTIGSYVLPPLSYLGAALDLPGSMVRDILAQENPLDQLLHPFDWSKRVSGAELLKKYGIIRRPDSWGGFAAGLAAEIALDPLSWFTFGGTKYIGTVGKALHEAGAIKYLRPVTKYEQVVGRFGRQAVKPVLRKGVREAIMEGVPEAVLRNAPREVVEEVQRKLVEAGVRRPVRRGGQVVMETVKEALPGGPFGIRAFPVFGPVVANIGGKRAARALDAFGLTLRSALPVRIAKQALSPAAGGALTARGQEAAEVGRLVGREAQEQLLQQVLRGGEELENFEKQLLGQLEVAPEQAPRVQQLLRELTVEHPRVYVSEQLQGVAQDVPRYIATALKKADREQLSDFARMLAAPGQKPSEALEEFVNSISPGALAQAADAIAAEATDQILRNIPRNSELANALRTAETADIAAQRALELKDVLDRFTEQVARQTTERLLRQAVVSVVGPERADEVLQSLGRIVAPYARAITNRVKNTLQLPVYWSRAMRQNLARLAEAVGLQNADEAMELLNQNVARYMETLYPVLREHSRLAARQGLAVTSKGGRAGTYFPRYLAEQMENQIRRLGIARRDFLNFLPGGRATINEIARDPAVWEAVKRGSGVLEELEKHLPMEQIRAVRAMLNSPSGPNLPALASLLPHSAGGAWQTLSEITRVGREAETFLDSLLGALEQVAAHQGDDIGKTAGGLLKELGPVAEQLGRRGLSAQHFNDYIRAMKDRLAFLAEAGRGILPKSQLKAIEKIDKLFRDAFPEMFSGEALAQWIPYRKKEIAKLANALKKLVQRTARMESMAQRKLLTTAHTIADLPDTFSRFLGQVASKVPDEAAKAGFSIYGDPLRDLFERSVRVSRAISNRRTALDLALTPGLLQSAEQMGDGVPLSRALEQAGIIKRIKSTQQIKVDPAAADFLTERLPRVIPKGSLIEVPQELAEKLKRIDDELAPGAGRFAQRMENSRRISARRAAVMARALLKSGNSTAESLGRRLMESVMDQLQVHPSLAEDLARITATVGSPRQLSQLEKAARWLRDVWTENVTVPWTAFHVRNSVGGLVQNVLAGALRIRDIPRAYRWSFEIMTGKTPKGLAKALAKAGVRGIKTDEEAVRWLERYLVASETVTPSQVMAVRAGESALAPGNPLRMLPHREPVRPARAFFGRYKGLARPREIDPLTGLPRTVTKWAPTHYGRELSRLTEGVNRVSAVLGEVLQGRNIREAAERAKLLHVDYAALTPFERRVLLTIFPFYSFFKGMSKFLAKELVEDPARLAAATRFEESFKPKQAPIPSYLRGTEAIPIAHGPEGTTYIGSLGLMHKDPIRMLGSLQDVREEIPSRASPLIRKPFEWLTGISLGRRGPGGNIMPLEEAETPLARIVENVRQLATGERGYRPLKPSTAERLLSDAIELAGGSRYLSSLRRLTDPRYGLGEKALNLLTGVRTYKVSPGMEEAVLRDYVTQRLRQMPESRTFERVYVPTRIREQTTGSRRRMIEAMLQAMRSLEQRAKMRAERYKNPQAPLPVPVQWDK